jgi:hypothetical protein
VIAKAKTGFSLHFDSNRRLRDQQCRRASGLRFPRNGDVRDLFQSLLAVVHNECSVVFWDSAAGLTAETRVSLAAGPAERKADKTVIRRTGKCPLEDHLEAFHRHPHFVDRMVPDLQVLAHRKSYAQAAPIFIAGAGQAVMTISFQ